MRKRMRTTTRQRRRARAGTCSTTRRAPWITSGAGGCVVNILAGRRGGMQSIHQHEHAPPRTDTHMHMLHMLHMHPPSLTRQIGQGCSGPTAAVSIVDARSKLADSMLPNFLAVRREVRVHACRVPHRAGRPHAASQPCGHVIMWSAVASVAQTRGAAGTRGHGQRHGASAGGLVHLVRHLMCSSAEEPVRVLVAATVKTQSFSPVVPATVPPPAQHTRWPTSRPRAKPAKARLRQDRRATPRLRKYTSPAW